MFEGTEAWALELPGVIAEADARSRLGPGLAPEPTEGGVRVELLVTHLTGVGVAGWPPRLSYWEALWRVGVLVEGVPGWWASRCDLDSLRARALAASLIRYPVRSARVAAPESGEGDLVVEAGSASLALRVEQGEPVPIRPPRPLWVGGPDRVFEVAWDEVPPVSCHAANVRIVDDTLATNTLGPVRFEPSGLLTRGRGHRCGVARAPVR